MTLSPTDHFIYLCLHVVRHESQLTFIKPGYDGQLRNLVDVATFGLKHQKVIRWQDLDTEAALYSHDVCLVVDMCLRNVNRIYGSILPKDKLAIDDHVAGLFGREIRHTAMRLNKQPVGYWSRPLWLRVFDVSRYDELIHLEETVRLEEQFVGFRETYIADCQAHGGYPENWCSMLADDAWTI